MAAPIFGCVLPGQPMICDFSQLTPTKLVTNIPNPGFVSDLTFFIFPALNSPIPPGYGAMLYYAVPPFVDWCVIGCVLSDKPSAIFHTGMQCCCIMYYTILPSLPLYSYYYILYALYYRLVKQRRNEEIPLYSIMRLLGTVSST